MLPTVIFLAFLALTLGLWYYYRRQYLATKVNEELQRKVILKIAVPRANKKSPLAAEQLYASLHGMRLNKAKSQDHISLEIAAGSYGIHFICVVSKEYKTFVENQIYGQYPEAQIIEISDYTETPSKADQFVTVVEVGLQKQFFLPIRTFVSFEVDPLAGLTSAMSNLPQGYEVFTQILARPISDSWQEAGRKYVKDSKKPKEGESETFEPENINKLVEAKSSKVGFQFVLRILAKTPSEIESKRVVNEVMAALGQYQTAVFNSLGSTARKQTWLEKLQLAILQLIRGKRKGERLSMLQKYKTRFLDEFESGIVNTEELASLYHLPNASVETPNIGWAMSRQLEFPLNVPTQDILVMGETDYRGIHQRFGLRPVDRLRHMYVIGKTGTGKSTFMENLILQDIYAGNGAGVIDPHGETIKHILERIPEHRVNDVVILAPGDTEFPVAWNLIEAKEGEDKSLIADGMVSVFKKLFKDSWGPRLEYFLTNTFLTLLYCQNVSILAVPRILSDDNYRKFLLKQVKDPILLKFWNEEYAEIARDPKRKSEEIASILNKIGRFTTNPIIRNMVGQISSSFDFRGLMDSGKILLVNLAQGKIGEENMSLLGGTLVTRIYSSIMQRVDTDPENRRPFYLYIDEFQNFANPTFEKILSESRKYGLSLNIAHQFIDQIDLGIRNAVFGNVGTLVNFAVGPRDAEYLVKEYAPYLEGEDLVNLPKYRGFTKLSIDGAQSKPFSMKTLQLGYPITNLEQAVIETSRKQFARERQVVEDKIFKWAGQSYNKDGNLMQKEQRTK
ncbi:MAG: type IV secretory system conjugative DNA transfer family protein [Candidatus Doudnabacteria bacterium]|nr:type IV secretory system conjugative DNA transfer family protein [Candidatus Doudnabacteria bacterium]